MFLIAIALSTGVYARIFYAVGEGLDPPPSRESRWKRASTKWGVLGVSTIARLAQADMLITDAGLSEAGRVGLGEQVEELVIADEVQRAGTLAAWRGDGPEDEG